MHLVINNFYNQGPEAMMDDLDRACEWARLSDTSDMEECIRLRDDIRQLEDKITDLQAGIHEALDALVSAGRKISAIKVYRTATKGGLKECKDYIESNFTDPPPTKPQWTCRDCVYRDDSFYGEPCKSCNPHSSKNNFVPIVRSYSPDCKACTSYTGCFDDTPCNKCYWNPQDDEE